MKKYKLFLFTALGLFSILSCQKEEDKITIDDANIKKPELISPANNSNIIFLEEDSAKNILFNWSEADYGYKGQAEKTYTIEIDSATHNFSKPITLQPKDNDSLLVIIKDLNKKITDRGDSTQITMEIRIKATMGKADTLFSPVYTVKFTPYIKFIPPPPPGAKDKVYLPGSYNSWDAKSAFKFVSVNNDSSFDGYIHFSAVNTEFQFTLYDDGTHLYGDNDGDGTLEPDGAKIKVASTIGGYKVHVNMDSLTYTIEKADWAIIGTATPNGWNAPDMDMTYDAGNNVWTITADLVAGLFKFRANEDWKINYGRTTDITDGIAVWFGQDIPLDADGNYTIVLDLSKHPYSYTITKN